MLTPGAAQQIAKLRADGLRDLGPAWATRVLGLIGGVGLLQGRNWARWLLVAWMVFHVGLSLFHSMAELLTHVAIFTPLGYLLFRREAQLYFDPAEAAET